MGQAGSQIECVQSGSGETTKADKAKVCVQVGVCIQAHTQSDDSKPKRPAYKRGEWTV